MAHLNWYILKSRRLFELKLATYLQKFNEFEVYLPVRKELKQWSDRKKMVTSPMIPGYLFVRCSPNAFTHLYTFSSFLGVLCEQKQYVTLSDSEIERLKALEAENPTIVLSDFEQLTTDDIYAFKDSVFKDVSARVVSNSEKTTVFILHTSSFPFRMVIQHKK